MSDSKCTTSRLPGYVETCCWLVCVKGMYLVWCGHRRANGVAPVHNMPCWSVLVLYSVTTVSGVGSRCTGSVSYVEHLGTRYTTGICSSASNHQLQIRRCFAQQAPHQRLSSSSFRLCYPCWSSRTRTAVVELQQGASIDLKSRACRASTEHRHSSCVNEPTGRCEVRCCCCVYRYL